MNLIEKIHGKISKEELAALIASIGEHEIRIDLDDFDFPNFLNRARLIQRALSLSVEKCEVFNTTHGFHIKIYLSTPLSPYELILIQSMLGDDPKHTLAAFQQLKQCVPCKDFNKLFLKKLYLDRIGRPFCASRETYNEALSNQLFIFLTNQPLKDLSNHV